MKRRFLLNALILGLPAIGSIAVVFLSLCFRYPAYALVAVGLGIPYLPLLLLRKTARVRIHPKSFKVRWSPGVDSGLLYKSIGSTVAFITAFGLLLLAWS